MGKKSNTKLMKNIYNEKDASMAYLFTVVFFLCMSIIVMVISQIVGAGRISSGKEIDSKSIQFMTMILTQMVFFAAFAFNNLINRTEGFRAAGLKKGFSPIFIPISVLIVMVLITFDVPMLMAWEWLLDKIGFMSENFTSIDVKSLANSPASLVMTIFVVCVLPAIGEELIFRGIIYRGIAASGQKGKALVLSSLAFALMHMSPLQTLHQFSLGFVAAYIVMRTDSLYPAMLVHFMNNFIFVLYEYFGLGLIGIDSIAFSLGAGLILAVIGILIICAVVDIATKNIDRTLAAGLVKRLKYRGKDNICTSSLWLDGKGAATERERFWLELPKFRAGIDDPSIIKTVTLAREQEQVSSYKKGAKGMFIAAVVICVVFWLINFATGFIAM